MAILQAILAFLFRSLGRILNTSFGWATVLLFGKVPYHRQIILSLVSLVSLLWLVVVIGLLYPRVAAFLVAFITLPAWLSDHWIRLIMLIAAVVLPAVAGVLTLYLQEHPYPLTLREKVRGIMKGYPFALGLAFTMLWLLVVAPILKLIQLIKRWTSAHIPVLIESKDYQPVVKRIQEILRRAGTPTQSVRAPWALRLPTKVLTLLGGGVLENAVADHLSVLRSAQLEILVYPSDLVVQGAEVKVTRTRAVLAHQLVFMHLYLTWSKEANHFEDRLWQLWETGNESAPSHTRLAFHRLRQIKKDLQLSKVDFEEWEILARKRDLIENHLLRRVLKKSLKKQRILSSK